MLIAETFKKITVPFTSSYMVGYSGLISISKYKGAFSESTGSIGNANVSKPKNSSLSIVPETALDFISLKPSANTLSSLTCYSCE